MQFLKQKSHLGIALAIILIAVGFFLLGLEPADNKLALNVAPFVLLFAYLVVIPWSLWKYGAKEDRETRGGV